MIKRFEHQERIWSDDPLWCGIFQGTGSMKTITSLGLAEGLTIVVVEKILREERKFERERDFLDKPLNMLVLSKEDFRRDYKKLPAPTTLIVDEADNFFGVLPETEILNEIEYPKTSLMFKSLLWFVRTHKPKRFYLLTATPASKPMHVWAIAKLLGKVWDFSDFRKTFYIEQKKGYKRFWLPKNTKALKQRLADNIKKLGYTGGLNDFFDVPEQVFKTIYVALTAEQKAEVARIEKQVADPMARRTYLRNVENGILYGKEIVAVDERTDRMVKSTTNFANEKIDNILRLAEEFPKMLVFADYLGQVDAIALALVAKGHKVLTLTGATKDRKSLLEQAELLEQCIVVASAKISAGYEWKSCPTVVFASKSNRYRNYEQGLGRVQRGDAIKKNLYINLVVRHTRMVSGKTILSMDESCHEAIMAGQDFQELIMD